MATITPVKITEEAIDSSLVECSSGGDDFINSGVEFIRVSNTHDSATYTITVTAQTTSYAFPRHGKLTKVDTVKSVSHGNSILIGPFKTTVWNDVNNKTQISYILGSSGSTAISGTHLLKIEALYLEQK